MPKGPPGYTVSASRRKRPSTKKMFGRRRRRTGIAGVINKLLKFLNK